MQVEAIPTAGLGDTTYLVVHDGVGVVVDPQRDVDRFEEAIAATDAQIRYVVETHIHNDYISGGGELARRTGAELVLPAGAGAAFAHSPAFHMEDIVAGSMVVRPIHTPGHTPEHSSYLVLVEGEDPILFSGGSLLAGTAGRTDLLGDERAHQLARLQHGSIHRLSRLPAATVLYPTHGLGSFCAASEAGRDVSTVGRERKTNPALAYPDPASFASGHLAGLGPYPDYYAQMGPNNLMGPPPFPAVSLQTLDPGELPPGAAVIDVRSRQAFAAGHLPGSIGLEASDNVAVWAGWLLPFNTEIVIVAEDTQDIDGIVRQFYRIGFDRVSGIVRRLGEACLPLVELESHSAASLAQALANGQDLQLLDVRSAEEWGAGHIPGSLHRYLPDLKGGLPEGVDRDRELWVVCGTGYRATAAVAFVEAEGVRPVVVNRGGVGEALAALGSAAGEA